MTFLLVLVAFVILGWGYYRAQPAGQIGVLVWLQSVVLMGPWLLLFGLLSLGITLNLASVLFLILVSISLYIILGKRLRQIANQEPNHSRSVLPLDSPETHTDTSTPVEPASSSSSPADALPSIPEIPLKNLVPPPVPAADLKVIQGLFGIDTFFATETVPYQDGVIVQGNLRGDAAVVHSQLTQQLETLLPEQYRLFLLSNTEDKPIVIVLPRRNDPKPGGWTQNLFAVILSIATFTSCLITGGFLLSFNLLDHPERFLDALPIGLGLMSVLAVHEGGHRFLAQRYQVKLSWPFSFPALQIGSFGIFNRFESLLPHRQSLFDIALAGPAAGGLFALILLIIGFLLSPSIPVLPLDITFLRSSILVGTLAHLFLGEALQTSPVLVHPLVGVGWIGLVITALNLMPAGSLDGGRIIQAIYGRQIARRATWITMILLAIIALANSIALYWAIIILFLQRDLERPSLDELTEPDDTRALLGLVALFLMVAILMPLAPGLASRIGIGA
ncbi:MAG: site-2 protease family protein [Acaryochloridaceae cyanobacterium CSU_3_4]|nr:site-2 protease family protein [Acaryochloridaceae cyanobacterium CSU_3_4]